MGEHWYQRWKTSKLTEPSSKGPRTMSSSEEIVWLREHVLKQGPKDNPPYEDAAKRLAELYAATYPGFEEDNAR